MKFGGGHLERDLGKMETVYDQNTLYLCMNFSKTIFLKIWVTTQNKDVKTEKSSKD